MAGTLTQDERGYSMSYEAGYIKAGMDIDPVTLRLGTKPITHTALPGVFADAQPAGFGLARLNARHGRELSPMELLDAGPDDAVGAIAVCADISHKLGWRAPTLDDLQEALRRLEQGEPASRAIMDATSAGGERPKVTVRDGQSLWLAKVQDSGDRPGMPALEFVAMSLAASCSIPVPATRLITAGHHQALLVERFDRHGSADRPCRRLFASAQTVLRLAPASVQGDAKRSYLDFAHEARRWANLGSTNTLDMGELWRRMVFNALVGNVDDHPRNHGLLNVDGAWRLAPAYDMTPIRAAAPAGPDPWPALSMAVHLSGSRLASPEHLLCAAPAFGLDPLGASQYLQSAAEHVTHSWQGLLRQALEAMGDRRAADGIVAAAWHAFAMAEQIADHPQLIEKARHLAMRAQSRRRKIPGLTQM